MRSEILEALQSVAACVASWCPLLFGHHFKVTVPSDWAYRFGFSTFRLPSNNETPDGPGVPCVGKGTNGSVGSHLVYGEKLAECPGVLFIFNRDSSEGHHTNTRTFFPVCIQSEVALACNGKEALRGHFTRVYCALLESWLCSWRTQGPHLEDGACKASTEEDILLVWPVAP